MSSEKTSAIVIRLVDFSETSSIVTLFTRDFGKLGALAKGARRPKSAFEAALDLLAICRIVLIRKSSGALDLLTEAKLERRFRADRQGLSHLYAGYYVAELLRELTDDGDAHPELYDLAVETLAELADTSLINSLVLRFELSALRLLGHAPSLKYCAETGQPVKLEGTVLFGVAAGGVLSHASRKGQSHLLMVRADVLRIMERFLYEDDSWRALDIDQATHKQIRRVINPYLYHLLGRKPRMHDYLPPLSG